MEVSEYDFLEVIMSEDPIDRGRIKIKFLDGRWRTQEETITMFEEVIKLIKGLKVSK
jgi:hypothetical protein